MIMTKKMEAIEINFHLILGRRRICKYRSSGRASILPIRTN